MKTTNSSPGANRDGMPSGGATDLGSAKTPNADMQAEDAGSADSGSASDESADDSATAATRAMKQTSKTAAESGGKR